MSWSFVHTAGDGVPYMLNVCACRCMSMMGGAEEDCVRTRHPGAIARAAKETIIRSRILRRCCGSKIHLAWSGVVTSWSNGPVGILAHHSGFQRINAFLRSALATGERRGPPIACADRRHGMLAGVAPAC